VRLKRGQRRRLMTLWGNPLWSHTGVGFLLLFSILSCRKEPAQKEESEAGASKPPEAVLPDLSGCTRAQIRLYPSALRWCGIRPGEEEGVLSQEELEYVESMRTIVSTDVTLVRSLSKDVAEAKYRGTNLGILRTERSTGIDLYRGDEVVLSFDLRRSHLLMTDGRQFESKRIWRSLSRCMDPLWPYQRRVACGTNLRRLHQGLRDSSVMRYPPYAQWCDVVQPKVRRSFFVCPARGAQNPEYFDGASRWICHYAMNPACERNSPPDTVLLFETKTGWNQHGGPELFTFDNHDPRGGCVLLNDGTLKFIRTEEELQQLRWN